MSNGRGSDRQLCALLAGAMTVPALQVFVGVPFRWVLLGTGAAAPVLALLWKAELSLPGALLTVRGGRALLSLCCLALTLGAAFVAGKSAVCFPQTETAPWTGAFVLLLAALAAHGGIEPLLRCGSILAVALGLLFGTVLGFSAPQLEPRYLAPTGRADEALPVFLLALLPALGLWCRDRIDRVQKRPGLWLAALILLPTAAAAITGGCLSFRIAAQPQPFRVLAQSVSLFGVIQRFEALSYGAELAGFFLLCALLLYAAENSFRALFPKAAKKVRSVVPAGLALALLLPSQRLPAREISVLTGLFCGLLPLGTLWVEKSKNFAKLLKKS